MNERAFSWLWAICGPVLMISGGAASAAPGVTVTVANGVMTVDPPTVQLGATEDSVVWTLNAPGYVFSAGDGIVVGGSGSKFVCAISKDGLSATCRRGSAGSGADRPYTINLFAVGSGPKPPPQPDIWIADY